MWSRRLNCRSNCFQLWSELVELRCLITKLMNYWLLNPAWWRHQIETFSALLAVCAGNSPVTGEFPHKGHWRGALMFSLICARINGWVNNRGAGDLRRHGTHYDVIVMRIVGARWTTSAKGQSFLYLTTCTVMNMMKRDLLAAYMINYLFM